MHTIMYTLARFFFRTIGRMSKGIRLCLDEGLTSGKTVDYVYNNQPQGSFLIGKMIDKQFLNHPGWEGVRQRRNNLETLMIETVRELREQKKTISLLDIASGPGAYIISVLEKVGENDITTLCRDLEDRWLIEGVQLATSKNLKKVRFEKADALDPRVFSSLHPKSNLIVVSGFYDWIDDDRIVKKSLLTIYEALDANGCFIMTNQTAHPNLEFVQQVFSDFNHNPLKMAMRSEALIQKWLIEAGFKVDKTLRDSKGYYSVTKVWKR